ncbi:MAG TPA: hypothetical protein VIN36_09565 [Thiobacillus sp.]
MTLAPDKHEALRFAIGTCGTLGKNAKLSGVALVGWRGAASARSIQRGKASIRHAALEGFGWGMAVALAVWLWGFSNAALAAGTVFDGLSPLEAHFWLVVATSLIPVLFIAGACGATTGVVLYFINLRLVRANPPLNTDAPPNGGAPVS